MAINHPDIKTAVRGKLLDLCSDTEHDSSGTNKNGENRYKLIRLSLNITQIAPLPWLNSQCNSCRIYWSDRETKIEKACVGSADKIIGNAQIEYGEVVSKISDKLMSGPDDAQYFGGLSFRSEISPASEWCDFATFQFILPRFEVITNVSHTRFVCNLLVSPLNSLHSESQLVLKELDDLNFACTHLEESIPSLVGDECFPQRPEWDSNIESTLNRISKDEFQKVVLARKRILRFKENLNPYTLLNNVRKQSTNCYHFCFQPSTKSALIGASPERLYKRELDKLTVEAVAGTATRGKIAEEDTEIGLELLESEKVNREHQYVVKNLKQALRTLGCAINRITEPALMKLSQLQHLFLEIRSVLPENVFDEKILAVLHPTPAVGGYPRNIALKYIDEIESFSRGWYAAPIGWIGINKSEFAVAIRSGLVAGSELSIFTGAGIVEGSVAGEEWQEIERKAESFCYYTGK